MSQQAFSVKTIVDKLSDEFELLFDFRVVCTKFPTPSYPKNMELSVLAEEMIKLEMSTINQWKVIDIYGNTKYKFHQ